MVRASKVQNWVALACVAGLLFAATLWWVVRDPGGNRLTAMFDKAVGLYAGSSVRVLGVAVGEVTGVTPRGQAVAVDMRVEDGVDLPADVGAVVMAPSLVSDRYVQLTPAYENGPKAEPGTVIAQDRTATPAELDELYGSLNELATGLGPDGANKDGALSGVLDTAAANLNGNGGSMNETVRRLGELSRTLNGSQGDLFETVRNLQVFTRTLSESDAQLNQFYARLADVTGFLASESEEVGAALTALSGALGEVQRFVADNRTAVESNVDKLTGITGVLVDQRAALAEILDVAPTGMTNFINTYDAASGSIAVRYNANELTHPLMTTVCRLISAGTPEQVPDTLGKLCADLAPLIDGTLKIPPLSQILASAQRGELPPLPLPLADVLSNGFGGIR
ncbi:MCE family protein [Amycolatopsis suaedae]|uniref:MCE family protein n=1 Tax=Amycolatopsis suaedae TaxID=2510978 RepID=A0A4Q7J6H9_9PSEU|nr:MCE family protein [Amycolatopsis suaedae]RZQ63231.1 MCE family protein [Amycolatopsis suaedae]